MIERQWPGSPGARDSARVKVAFSSDAGASWGAPAVVDDGTPVGRVDVSMLEDGSALVSWLERTGGESAAVRVRRVHADGRRDAAVEIATSGAARSAGFPRMVASGGWLYLAWTEPGATTHVRLARLPLAPGAVAVR